MRVLAAALLLVVSIAHAQEVKSAPAKDGNGGSVSLYANGGKKTGTVATNIQGPITLSIPLGGTIQLNPDGEVLSLGVNRDTHHRRDACLRLMFEAYLKSATSPQGIAVTWGPNMGAVSIMSGTATAGKLKARPGEILLYDAGPAPMFVITRESIAKLDPTTVLREWLKRSKAVQRILDADGNCTVTITAGSAGAQ